mmetsp:Transcript_20413/g.62116  ORF Transcript_20413/g.62116 Transcript_20413/m.62116 type:complete len:272 (+) Transcript_20413:478-1293(+)
MTMRLSWLGRRMTAESCRAIWGTSLEVTASVMGLTSAPPGSMTRSAAASSPMPSVARITPFTPMPAPSEGAGRRPYSFRIVALTSSALLRNFLLSRSFVVAVSDCAASCLSEIFRMKSENTSPAILLSDAWVGVGTSLGSDGTAGSSGFLSGLPPSPLSASLESMAVEFTGDLWSPEKVSIRCSLTNSLNLRSAVFSSSVRRELLKTEVPLDSLAIEDKAPECWLLLPRPGVWNFAMLGAGELLPLIKSSSSSMECDTSMMPSSSCAPSSA